jgi:DNA-directed RNA polymerase subunit H
MPELAPGSAREIFKCRRNLIDILRSRGFDASNYSGESMNEVSIMAATKQLDMFLTAEDPERRVFVKFHLGKGLRENSLHEYIEETFEIDQALRKADELIIVVQDEPNDSLTKALRNVWEREGYFVTAIPVARLQFNVLSHALVPPHRKLSAEESKEIRELYNIMSDSEVPDISRFSPVAQALGLRPGDMCEIIRPSKTAITTPFYRICSS